MSTITAASSSAYSSTSSSSARYTVPMPEPVRADSTSVSLVSATAPLPGRAFRAAATIARYPSTAGRPSRPRTNRPERPRNAQLPCAGTANGEGRREPATPVIRDQLLAALHAALDACGFPAPPGGIELTVPKDPG